MQQQQDQIPEPQNMEDAAKNLTEISIEMDDTWITHIGKIGWISARGIAYVEFITKRGGRIPGKYECPFSWEKLKEFLETLIPFSVIPLDGLEELIALVKEKIKNA